MTSSFAFRLYPEMLKVRADRNVFVSPANILLALQMVANGAAGATREALRRALDLPGVSHEEANRACAALAKALKEADPKVCIETANSIWLRRGFALRSEFVRTVSEEFRGTAAELEFDHPDASSAVDDWVKKRTRGAISRIAPSPIPPDMMMLLVSAAYFKARWSRVFEKSATSWRPFHKASGHVRSVPMMVQHASYRYAPADRFRAIRIPYGEYERLALYVILPDEGATLSDACGNLTADVWRSLTGRMRERECDLELPRFKVEFEAELADPLRALGMAMAFEPGADFSGASSHPLFLQQVRHKTFVEMNEEGTEAAAVASGEILLCMELEPEESVLFRVDRPFFCVIQDDATGAILFMGSILDPE